MRTAVCVECSRQRSKRERLSRSKSSEGGSVRITKDKEALSNAEQQFSKSLQSGGGFKARCKVMPSEGIKREKAMYEHVGRMNYRPFIDCEEHDLEVCLGTYAYHFNSKYFRG